MQVLFYTIKSIELKFKKLKKKELDFKKLILNYLKLNLKLEFYYSRKLFIVIINFGMK